MSNEKKETITSIEYLLRCVCFKIKQNGREILEDFDITPPQFDALQFIEDEEMTVGELSSRLYLAPSTITDLVDRMEKNNLVERVREAKDRRSVKIKIKRKGLDLIKEVIDRRCSYVDKLLKELGESEKLELIKYLNILNRK